MFNLRSAILIFFLISLSFQKEQKKDMNLRVPQLLIPERDSFVPINSNVLTLIELKEGQRELFYTFDNQFDGSDIVVNLKVARQYTTRLYFFDSYENIKINETTGEYIGFLEELDLSEKLLYIKSTQKNTYYIIIKDLGNFSTKDYISIYNEQDIIELKSNEPFTINLFLSKNLYTFTFNGEKDEVISLDMNINNEDFQEAVIIYLNDELIYQGERNKGLIKLNEDRTSAGTYKVYLTSANEEVYTYIKSSIVLYKEKNTVLELEPEKEVNLFYLNSKTFSFYVDINDYELNEENIITFKYDHMASINKLIEYCYAKNMNFKEFDDAKFMSNMPAHEEESEADFSRLNTWDNLYHLYFKRTQESEEDKKSYLLVHCSIKIDEEKYFAPQKISVYLSPKAISFDFSDKKYLNSNGNIKINENIQIDDFIPKICKVNMPKNGDSEENKLSYVFYTNVKIQSIFEDSMIKSEHTNEDLKHIYVVSHKSLKVSNKIIYIKLFGAKQEINFKVESTNSEIYYTFGESRTPRVLSQQHLNCENSFYYIGSYSVSAEDTKFYLEEIYGKYNLYYKNSLTNNDNDSILTDGNEKYLINSKTGLLSKTFDIVELKCETPGYFNLHILKTYFTRTLTMYQRQVAFAPTGQLYIYPKANEGQTKINLEITTLLGKEVEINYYNGSSYAKAIIDSNNKYFQIKYKKAEDVPSYMRLYIKEENTLLSIRLTDDYLYKIVEENNAKINEELILFKLANKQDYKKVNITLKRVFHEYTYTMFRGNIGYAVDPILSGYETIPLGEDTTINFILSNPYIKYNSIVPDSEESPFYIMFYIYDPEGVQKNIYMEYIPVEEYDEFPNSVSKILDAKGDKYSLNIGKDIPNVSIIYQSCGNSLKELKIYSYDDLLNTYEAKDKYNLGGFKNYLIPSQIGPIFENDEGNKYTGAVVGISLNKLSQSDIDNINNFNYEIKQNGKTIKWEKLDGVKEYLVYVFNMENEDLQYIQNPCFLDYIQKKSLSDKNETDPQYIAYYSAGSNNYYNVKENGLFVVTVLANLEGKMPIKYIYKELNYNSSMEPYEDDEGKSNHTVLIVLLIAIPIIIILIVVLIVVLVRRNRQKDIVLSGRQTRLMGDTTNNSNNISSQEE